MPRIQDAGVRHDVVDLHKDRRDLGKDLAQAAHHEAARTPDRRERKDVARDVRDLHHDKLDLAAELHQMEPLA